MPLENTALFRENIQYLKTEVRYFNGIIGGWPIRIRDAKELQQVRQRWDKAVSVAQSLLKQQPNSLEVKYTLAELLRMGHNMDAPGAGQACHTHLQEIIQTNPHFFWAYFSLASFYVSIDPNAAPLAERLFLKAETLAAPNIIPSIYQGLGFACVYQNKIPDAINYFDKYLQLQSDPEIQHLLDGLRSGKKPKITFQESN